MNRLRTNQFNDRIRSTRSRYITHSLTYVRYKLNGITLASIPITRSNLIASYTQQTKASPHYQEVGQSRSLRRSHDRRRSVTMSVTTANTLGQHSLLNVDADSTTDSTSLYQPNVGLYRSTGRARTHLRPTATLRPGQTSPRSRCPLWLATTLPCHHCWSLAVRS